MFLVSRGVFRFSTPLLQRQFSTSIHLVKALPKQEVTISQKLREKLLAQMRESELQQQPKQIDCNCLPLNGTKEHERTMDAMFENLKMYTEVKGH